MTRAAAMLALLAALALLPACGGSDEPIDDRATINPPACETQPELCQ